MTVARAALILAVLAAASAGLLAIASRAPLEVRRVSPHRGQTSASLGDRFTEQQIARAGAYRGPGYLFLALSTALNIAALTTLARGPFGRVVERMQVLPGGWMVHAAVLGAILAVVTALVLVPLGYVRGFAMEHAWGLSTQSAPSWVGDQLRSLSIGAVVAAVASVAFFAVVRWQPRAWWLWGWATFSLLTVLFVLVWPVVVAPLFNEFTPLEDAALTRRIKSVASRAGVEIDRVLVADASRRTTAENAYVAGLAGTKRMVLYDTLLASGNEAETMFVVAHELGHEAERHVVKNVLLSSVGLLAGFAVLAALATRTWLWSWSGASGVGDLRALPVLVLFATVLGIALLPVETAISRNFEARADEVAISLTRAPDAAVSTFRRLAFSNLADLRPPSAAVLLLYTHPPTQQRIRAVLRAP